MLKNIIITFFVIVSAVYSGIETTWNSTEMLGDGTIKFDVAVSLHDKPTDAKKALLEVTLETWAQAVYEMTNGAHIIGKVRVFQSGYSQTHSSILWSSNQSAFSHVGGWGDNSKKILLGDTTLFNQVTIELTDVVTAKKLGLILASEWAKYAYSILSQRASINTRGADWEPLLNDFEIALSITSDPLKALDASGNITKFEYLNFEGTGLKKENAQGRVYKKNSWSTLKTLLDHTDNFPIGLEIPVVVWPTLKNYAPVSTDTYGSFTHMKVVTNGSTAWSDALSIEWRSNAIVAELVIDKSGSMGTTKLENAKNAAQKFVNTLPEDARAHIGVIAFDTDVDEVVTITRIDDATTKTTVNAGIQTINSELCTNLYGAAIEAVDSINTYSAVVQYPEVPFKYTVLLSDGDHYMPEFASNPGCYGNIDPGTIPNDSETDVATKYDDNDIPLHTIAYGTGAPVANLERMSTASKGVSTISTDVVEDAEMTNFYNQVYDAAAQIQIIKKDIEFDVSGNATFTFPTRIKSFQYLLLEVSNKCQAELTTTQVFDNTSTEFVFTADEITHTAATAEFDYTSRYYIKKSKVATAQFSKVWSVHISGCSDAALTIKYATNTADIDGTVQTARTVFSSFTPVAIAPAALLKTSVQVALAGHEVYTYPEPVLITSALFSSSNMTNLNMMARVVDPNGNEIVVPLNDQGYMGDFMSQDGVYSYEFNDYTMDGLYTVTVFSKNSGIAGPYGSSSFLNYNFSRSVETAFTVQNVVADDQIGNYPRSITASNIITPGKIDGDDTDWFEISNVDESQDMMVRVAHKSDNIDLVLRVWDGNTVIAEFNKNYDCADNGYALLSIPKELVRNGLVVEIGSTKNTMGVYALSVGEKLDEDGTGSVVVGPNFVDDYITPYPGAVTGYQFKSGLWPQVVHSGDPSIAPNFTSNGDARFAFEYISNNSYVVQFMMNLNPSKFGTALERFKNQGRLSYDFNTEYPEFTISESAVDNLAGRYYLRMADNTVYWVRTDNTFMIKWTTNAPQDVVIEEGGSSSTVVKNISVGKCEEIEQSGQREQFDMFNASPLAYGYFPNKAPYVHAEPGVITPDFNRGERFNIHWIEQNGAARLIEFSINIGGVPIDNYHDELVHNFTEENPMFTIENSSVPNLDGSYYIQNNGGTIVWVRVDNLLAIEWR
ncbi:MAG: VWA domain-containing protein [Fibrobacterales bacterium]